MYSRRPGSRMLGTIVQIFEQKKFNVDEAVGNSCKATFSAMAIIKSKYRYKNLTNVEDNELLFDSLFNKNNQIHFIII